MSTHHGYENHMAASRAQLAKVTAIRDLRRRQLAAAEEAVTDAMDAFVARRTEWLERDQ